jgi:hypothetical protein
MRAGKAGSIPGLRQLVTEIFGKFSNQNGDHVARRVDLGDQRRDLRLQLRQFALRQRDVQLVGDAAIVALLDEVDVFLRHLDILAQHRELHLQRAQIEIGAGHVGDERYQHHVAGGDGGVDVVMRGLDGAAEFAENVDFPPGIEANDICDSRKARAVLGGDEGLRHAAARQVAACTQCSAFARLGRGQRRADDHGLLRARLLQTVQSDFQRRARRDGAVDQRIQFAVVQRSPPLGRNGGLANVGPGRRRNEAFRHRRLGGMIIGADGAGRQTEKGQGAKDNEA